MNKSKYILVVCLAIGAITSGLVMGYVNAQKTNQSALLPNEQNQASDIASKKPLDTPHKILNKAIFKASDNKSNDSEESNLPEDYDVFDQQAIDSMTDARLNGDDRAPPIGQHVESEVPTAEELGSPELYLEFETRQEKKIYRSYIEAADIKIEMLEGHIAKAKERGLPEEELAVGLEKVRLIKEMKAQLLLDHPELQL